MNVKRYVNMGFVLGGILAWLCFGPFFAWLFEVVAPSWDGPIVGADFRISDLLGLTAAVLLTAYLFVREDIYTQAMEIGNELSKVTWPKWDETRTATIVVVITTIIIAAILGGFDLIWAKVTGWIYGIG